MNNLSTIRLELDINAQKILQQVSIHNEHLEKSVKAGIERALDEIFKDNNFENRITILVKEAIDNTVKKAASDWVIQRKIHEAIHNNIEKEIEIKAKNWAERLTKDLT